MKICVILLALAAVAVALPIEGDNIQEPSEWDAHFRARRATCDLLSAFKVDHSACAAHCIARGKSGGSCDSRRICRCRQESLTSWVKNQIKG